MREARNACRARMAAFAGGVPASVPRMIFLLFGQMMPQTLNSITMPNPAANADSRERDYRLHPTGSVVHETAILRRT